MADEGSSAPRLPARVLAAPATSAYRVAAGPRPSCMPWNRTWFQASSSCLACSRVPASLAA